MIQHPVRAYTCNHHPHQSRPCVILPVIYVPIKTPYNPPYPVYRILSILHACDIDQTQPFYSTSYSHFPFRTQSRQKQCQDLHCKHLKSLTTIYTVYLCVRLTFRNEFRRAIRATYSCSQSWVSDYSQSQKTESHC